MKYFSKIDLTSSFYQIPIDETSQDITSFVSPFGQYKFTTLLFGLKSSPKLFQRTISEVLKDIENIIIFVDDISIYNKDLDEHVKNVYLTIQTLQENCLQINFYKSIFLKGKMNFLGMEIDGEGITQI